MKKITALLLALILALSMTACGGDAGSSENEADSGAPQEEVQAENGKADKTVIVDHEDFRITFTGVEPDYLGYYCIDLLLENKTDQQLSFGAVDTSVNGLQVVGSLSSTLQSGEKRDDRLMFEIDSAASDWKAYGLDLNTVTDVGVEFGVSNREYETVYYGLSHIYPMGESQAITYERAADEQDVVLMDNEYAKITYIGEEDDSIWGYMVHLYVENKTDHVITLQKGNASANGVNVSTSAYSERIMANCAKFTHLDLDANELSENGITEIDSLEVLFRIFDGDNTYSENYVEETMTLTK